MKQSNVLNVKYLDDLTRLKKTIKRVIYVWNKNEGID